MEFTNRQTSTPGRIKLRNTNTGQEKICDVTLADNPIEVGTILTAEVFNQFKQDVIAEAIKIGGQGEKGEKGDKGNQGVCISSITLRST